MRRQDIEDIYTLSPMQQGMLFEILSEPDSGAYFEQGLCKLSGDLDVEAFEVAWRQLISRHSALRTAFAWEGLSKPVQIVYREAQLNFERIDWSDLPDEQHDRQLRNLISRNRHRAFDLASPPLMRLTLIRLAKQSYQFVWAIHHLVHDAWSTFLLLQEALTLYADLREGCPVSLAVAPPYKQYVSYLKQRPATDATESFWRGYLRGFKAPASLPETPQQRQSHDEELHAQQETRLSHNLTAAIDAFARRNHLTLNTLALASWSLVLGHYSDKRDVLFGTVVSGRPEDLEEADRMVGLFINTLPMRVEVPPPMLVIEWLRSLQEAQTKLRQYEFTPLRQARGWSELPPHARIFDTILVFQNAFIDVSGREIGGLKIDHIRSVGHSNVPFTMRVTPGRELLLEVIYDTRRFAQETVSAVLRKMAETLETIAATQPDAIVNTLSSAKPAGLEHQQTAPHQNERRPTLKLKLAQPKTVRLSPNELTKRELLTTGKNLPLLIQPNGHDLILADWVANYRERIEQDLHSHGAILFRGFTIDSIDDFRQFVRTISPELLEYRERSTPRTDLGGNIYTSTEYPAHQTIAFHNEFSYAYTWPMKICFHCVVAPGQGGETPIADSRQVFQLLDPKLRERFIEKGVMYVRNYGSGIDLSWQEVFRTTSKLEVEEHCRNSPMLWEWKGEDRLRTTQVRPAVAQHPKTGEMVWFNQVHLFHLSNLEPAVRRSMRETFHEEDLPRQAYYGDGSAIEDSVLDEVRDAYRLASISFPWEPGDVLLLDNMLTAHGRHAFVGERRILAAMAEPFTLKIEKPAMTFPAGA